ncbi:MAG: hypothetical protein FWG12_06600 [Holophagaceae bacterium]|nr:hypothetical protein [Holophagaceae bacterium]
MFATVLRASAYAFSIAACAMLSAQAQQARRLESNVVHPLLVLQERGADLRYFIEPAAKNEVFWIANKGSQEAHFAPVWIMHDGRPQGVGEGEGMEGESLLPPPRVHIGPMGRIFLMPPRGFKELMLTEIRVGSDQGPFLDEVLPEGAGRGGQR